MPAHQSNKQTHKHSPTDKNVNDAAGTGPQIGI